MAHRTIELTLEEFLLKFSFCDLNLDCLINLLVVSALVIGIVLDRCREESVDKRRLSQPGLSSDLYSNQPFCSTEYQIFPYSYHYREGSAALCNDFVAKILSGSSTLAWADRKHTAGLATGAKVSKIVQYKQGNIDIHWQCQLEMLTRPWRALALQARFVGNSKSAIVR